MIRVGFILPSLLRGGAELRNVLVAEAIPGNGFSLSGIANVSGVEDQRIGDRARRAGPVFTGPGSVAEIASRSDVLITWAMGSLPWMGAALAGFRGPVVLTAAGADEGTRVDLAKSLGWGTHWVAISRVSAACYPDPSRVTIIHDGICPERCRPVQGREAMRTAWGLRTEEIAVGHLGRIVAVKRPLVLACAVRRLGRPFRAVYVGGGPETESWLGPARDLCPDLIYAGVHDTVGDPFAGLDCYLNASGSEGFCNALIESMLCGCPVVSTPVGAVPELEERHGRLTVPVAIGDGAEELAAAIHRAIEPENRETVERARRVVQENHLAQHMTDGWRALLRRIVSDSTAARKQSIESRSGDS